MVLKISIVKLNYPWQYYEACFQYMIKDLVIGICKRDDAVIVYGNYNKVTLVISRKSSTTIDICNLLSYTHSTCLNKINGWIKEKINELRDILLLSDGYPIEDLEAHNLSLINYLEHVMNHIDLNVRAYNINNGDIVPYITSLKQEMTSINRTRLESYYESIGRSDFDIDKEMEKSEKFKEMITGSIFKKDKPRIENLELEVE